MDDFVLPRIEDVSWSMRTVAQPECLVNVVGASVGDYGEVLVWAVPTPLSDDVVPDCVTIYLVTSRATMMEKISTAAVDEYHGVFILAPSQIVAVCVPRRLQDPFQ